MAAALSIAAPTTSTPDQFHGRTINGSGLAATTAYVVFVTHPSGGIQKIRVTTNGSGAFSAPLVIQERGPVSLSIRPTAEVTGTTTAAATTSVTVS